MQFNPLLLSHWWNSSNSCSVVWMCVCVIPDWLEITRSKLFGRVPAEFQPQNRFLKYQLLISFVDVSKVSCLCTVRS